MCVCDGSCLTEACAQIRWQQLCGAVQTTKKVKLHYHFVQTSFSWCFPIQTLEVKLLVFQVLLTPTAARPSRQVERCLVAVKMECINAPFPSPVLTSGMTPSTPVRAVVHVRPTPLFFDITSLLNTSVTLNTSAKYSNKTKG